MNTLVRSLVSLSLGLTAANLQAQPLNVFDETWTKFDYVLDGTQGRPEHNYYRFGTKRLINNDPEQMAWNNNITTQEDQGQEYDAEYLFYKYDKKTQVLSLGLQTGFNLLTNEETSGDTHPSFLLYERKTNSGGDIRLNIGNKSFAVDFGMATHLMHWQRKATRNEAYYNAIEADNLAWDGVQLNGSGDAGVYAMKDTDWNHDTGLERGQHQWARDTRNGGGGTKVADLLTNDYGNNNGDKWTLSHYRTVSFNLKDVLGEGFNNSDLDISAFWTMSCGNDIIQGKLSIAADPDTVEDVPEPTSLALLGLGLAGLGFSRKRKKNA